MRHSFVIRILTKYLALEDSLESMLLLRSASSTPADIPPATKLADNIAGLSVMRAVTFNELTAYLSARPRSFTIGS